MHLIWTKEKPKCDGWYWCKCYGSLSGELYETMVKVYNQCNTVFWDGTNYSLDCPSFAEWSDSPIERPH